MGVRGCLWLLLVLVLLGSNPVCKRGLARCAESVWKPQRDSFALTLRKKRVGEEVGLLEVEVTGLQKAYREGFYPAMLLTPSPREESSESDC